MVDVNKLLEEHFQLKRDVSNLTVLMDYVLKFEDPNLMTYAYELYHRETEILKQRWNVLYSIEMTLPVEQKAEFLHLLRARKKEE